MAERRETPEYVAMLSRMVRGLGRRISTDGNPSDLADAVRLQAQLDAVIADAVRSMKDDHGYSWQQLADELGMTRQGVQQRYARRINKETPK